MELDIAFRTPGPYLSTRTAWGIISDISKCIDRGMATGLNEAFPEISKRTARRRLRGQSDLVFVRVQKGSWEIGLVAAVGGFLLKVALELVKDALKEGPGYQKLKDLLTSRISKPSANAVADEFKRQKSLGPMLVASKTVEIINRDDGTQIVKYHAELTFKDSSLSERQGVSTETQLQALAQELSRRKKHLDGGVS